MKQSVKKLLTMILTLSMVMMMAVPAFADGDNGQESTTASATNVWNESKESGSASQDVTASYTAPDLKNTGTVYYVTIKWEATTVDEALSFTGRKATYTWDGASLKYNENEGATAAAWSGAAGYKVTVTNQSNDVVYATTEATNTYNLTLKEPVSTTQEVKSAAVDSSGKTILYSNVDTKGNAKAVDFTYTYTANSNADEPDVTTNSTVTVGTISLTISKTEPTSASDTSGENN
jgi:predicted secreted protein